MNKKSLSFVIIILFSLTSFYCATIFASDIEEPVPPSLQYQGKRISPNCIEKISHSIHAKINLETCVEDKKTSDGYEYLGKYENYDVIYLSSSTGFTYPGITVFLLEREANTIQNVNIVIPRAEFSPYVVWSGSIDKINLNKGKLIYDLNIDFRDYLKMSGIEIPEIKCHELSSVPQGIAHYESDFKNSQFKSITIGELSDVKQYQEKGLYAKHIQPLIKQCGKPGIYDECFQTLLKTYKEQGKEVLTEDDLKQLVKQFKMECIK